jgi:hypothetical protein
MPCCEGGGQGSRGIRLAGHPLNVHGLQAQAHCCSCGLTAAALTRVDGAGGEEEGAARAQQGHSAAQQLALVRRRLLQLAQGLAVEQPVCVCVCVGWCVCVGGAGG